MNILPLVTHYGQLINSLLSKNPLFHQIEERIGDFGDELTLDILRGIIESIDQEFRDSEERKKSYYIQRYTTRTLITSLGIIEFTKTYYKSKKPIDGKYEFFSYIEEVFGVEKWAKMTLSAEAQLIKVATETNMEYAAKNALRGVTVSRQAISAKVKKLNVNPILNVERVHETPEVLYIETDEVHANLQDSRNKIVPVSFVHEGHKESFTKRKELKNPHYFASSLLTYEELYHHVYDFCDKKYDLSKVKYIFVSGDAGSGIKTYDSCFPNAIYVLDKFHYRKALNYIFKRDPHNTKLADDYLRARMIDEFRTLCKMQMELHPKQEQRMTDQMEYLINNIDGIINQRHEKYLCPASMEGVISHKYAKYITSRPFGFSKDGLENKIQLLTLQANKGSFDTKQYARFKYEDNYYKHSHIHKHESVKWYKPKNNPKFKYLNVTHNIPALVNKNLGVSKLIKSVIRFKI